MATKKLAFFSPELLNFGMAERINPYWTEHEGVLRSIEAKESGRPAVGKCSRCPGTAQCCIRSGVFLVMRDEEGNLTQRSPLVALRRAHSLIDYIVFGMQMDQFAVDQKLLSLAEEFLIKSGIKISDEMEKNLDVLRQSAQENIYSPDAIIAGNFLRNDIHMMFNDLSRQTLTRFQRQPGT